MVRQDFGRPGKPNPETVLICSELLDTRSICRPPIAFQIQLIAMGRYDFRPTKVHQLASQVRETARNPPITPWYDVVGRIPPSQCLVRTQPLPHQKQNKNRIKPKKPSKLFQPQIINYEEDNLRREFFGDHPWELARPRMVLEGDGKDSHKTDWSRIRQSHTPFNGEK